MRYQITANRGVVHRIDEDGSMAVVASHSSSEAQRRDWEDYLAWLQNGNIPDPLSTHTETYVENAKTVEEAIHWGIVLLKTQLRIVEENILDGYTTVQLLSQTALTPELREPEFDSMIQQINAAITLTVTAIRSIRTADTQEAVAVIVDQTLPYLQ